MKSFYEELGENIRFFRKKSGIKLGDFATMLNKGYSTVSKYESGSIAIDAETLFTISSVLEISVDELFNQNKEGRIEDDANIPKQVYIYYYSIRYKKVVTSIIEHNPTSGGEKQSKFYFNVEDNDKKSCTFYYTGEYMANNLTLNYVFENRYNAADFMHLTTVRTMRKDHYSVGMLMGLVGQPFSLSATKYISSARALEEDEISDILETLQFTKDEIACFKKENRFRIDVTR